MTENKLTSCYITHMHNHTGRHRIHDKTTTLTCHVSPMNHTYTQTCRSCPTNSFTEISLLWQQVSHQQQLTFGPWNWAKTFKRVAWTMCRAFSGLKKKKGRVQDDFSVILQFNLGGKSVIENILCQISVSKLSEALSSFLKSTIIFQAPAATSFLCNTALLCAKLVLKVSCVNYITPVNSLFTSN